MLETKHTIEAPIHLLLKHKPMLTPKVNDQSISRFVKDLSTLINSSVPLVKSLEVLANQQSNKEFKNIIKNLAQSVHGGTPFSLSLMKYPKTFDPLFINIVKAGELSSNLGLALGRIAKHKEKELKLKKKIKSIMIYPFIVITISMIIVSSLFLFIIPKFESVFTSMINPGSIPFSTKFILDISNYFPTIFTTSFFLMCIIILTIKFSNKSTKDNILLKIPFIGNLIKDINIALFSKILGTLIANGVPLIEALKISQNLISNYKLKNIISNACLGITDGEPLSQVLASQGQFPEIAISLIHVGEETGTLSKMLLELANKFDEDIELKLENLTSILEPIMTVILAITIGSIVIALFLPIINIMNNIVTF